MPLLWIVNKNLVLKHIEPGDYGEYGDYGQAWLNENDAGSGPYMLKTKEIGTRISWTRFDDYFRGWREEQIDEVQNIYTKEDATVVSLIKTRQLNMSCAWRSYETMKALKKLPGFTLR